MEGALIDLLRTRPCGDHFDPGPAFSSSVFERMSEKSKTMSDLTLAGCVLCGVFAQAVALIPGVSRSGSRYSAGMSLSSTGRGGEVRVLARGPIMVVAGASDGPARHGNRPGRASAPDIARGNGDCGYGPVGSSSSTF